MVIDHQLNPSKYSQQELDKNAHAAAASYVSHAATDSSHAAAAADASHAAANVDYWLDEYFKQTGENKQDYIDAINKDNKQC
jgi:hypothetical protein